ncbi:MAG: type IV secretion system protein VirB10 [Alphaproteobacteria bacterium]|nr:type IV secretion system protein VirB10 [Alphaproteobacteria bacterium]
MNDKDENFDKETGEIIGKTQIPGDRGVSPVAVQEGSKVIGMGILVIVAILAIAALLYGEMTKNQNKSVTEVEEIAFRAPKTKNEPYIATPQAPIPPQETLQSPQQQELQELDKLRIQQQLAMQAEALRQAQERQKAMEERIKSPQLVYDQSGFTPNAQSQSGNAATTPIGGALLLSGGTNEQDPHLAFAQEQGNAKSGAAQATQLLNLDTLIAQGEMISGVLETAIQSDLPGMVRAIISENIYSFEGSNLLIPKGTRLVGQYRAGTNQGQSRVFIIWNRLIRPDGASINIGSFGTDSLGRSGLAGNVDTHFMERFGASVLLSMIDGAVEALANSVEDDNAANVSISGGNNFSRSSEIALENSIGIKPTIYVDQGTRIKVFVGKDLDFSNVGGMPL